MKKLFLALFLVAYPSLLFAFGSGMQGCSGDCTSCHKITKEEAVKVMNDVDPALQVVEVVDAPARGLYQLTVKKEGQTGVLYLDFAKKHVIAGKVFEIQTRRDLTQKSIEDATVIDPAKIPVKNAIILGNPRGSKQVYVFSDPECPFCGKLHKDLLELVKEDPQLKVNIVLVPLDSHPNAGWKSTSIVCRSKESMKDAVRMLEESYEGKDVKKIDCGLKYAEEIKRETKGLGISMTPMLVLPSGKTIFGAKPKDELRKAFEQLGK